MPLGQDLRTARLNRRLTLSQVAERTHIKFKILDAIENEDFSAVPAAIYAKGFIRLYAECVGLDANQLIEEYVTRFGPSASAAAKLDKEMFTIDRNGIVTRRDSALANLPDEEPVPANHPTPAASPEPTPAIAAAEPLPEPESSFKLVADDPTPAKPITPAPMVEPVVPATVVNRHVQPDLFDAPARQHVEPALQPLAPIVEAAPAPVVAAPVVVTPEPAPAPVAAQVVTQPEPVVVATEKHETPKTVTESPKEHTEPVPGKAHRPPLQVHRSPTDAGSTAHGHEGVSAGRSDRPGTSSAGTPNTAKHHLPDPIDDAPPGFPFKGIVITLGTAALLILCLTGLARLFGNDDPEPVTPPAPAKSATLRLAVDPPAPYFN